jgi:hypothetical protein
MWEEAGITSYNGLLSQQFPEKLGKIKAIFCHDSAYPDGCSNRLPAEYEAE